MNKKWLLLFLLFFFLSACTTKSKCAVGDDCYDGNVVQDFDKTSEIDETPEVEQVQDVDNAETDKVVEIDKTSDIEQSQDADNVEIDEVVEKDETPEVEQTQDIDNVEVDEVVEIDETPEIEQVQDADDVELDEVVETDESVETDEFVETDEIQDEDLAPQYVWVDTKSNLMWQNGKLAKEKTWEDAKKYCNTLVLDGFSDWRLPTIEELRSLIRGCDQNFYPDGTCEISTTCNSYNNCKSKCGFCENFKGGGENGTYLPPEIKIFGRYSFWSSTENSDNGGTFAFIVNFNQGSVGIRAKYSSTSSFSRCVRDNL